MQYNPHKNKDSQLNPLLDSKKEPSVMKKIVVYSSMGLLWMVTLFGLLFAPVIIQLGSEHSYVADKVNSQVWLYFYVVVALYTLIMTFYIALKGFSANYIAIAVLNSLFLSAFSLVTFMSFFLIFFLK